MSAYLSAYSFHSERRSNSAPAGRLDKAGVSQLVEKLICNPPLSANIPPLSRNSLRSQKLGFSLSSANTVFYALAVRRTSPKNFAGGTLPCYVFSGTCLLRNRRPQINLKGGALPHVNPKSPRPTSICPRPPLYYSMAYANPKQGAGMNTIPSAATMARSSLPQPRRRRR